MKNNETLQPPEAGHKKGSMLLHLLCSGPYLVWMAIFILVPLGVVVFYALTDSATGMFTLDNLAKAFSPAFLKIFGRSVWYSLLASFICLVVGYPVAYLIARQKPGVQRTLYMLSLIHI